MARGTGMSCRVEVEPKAFHPITVARLEESSKNCTPKSSIKKLNIVDVVEDTAVPCEILPATRLLLLFVRC